MKKRAVVRKAFSVALRPFRAFLEWPTANGILLLGATLSALIWANSPLRDSYDGIFDIRLSDWPLRQWINDALMSVFFLVVGMEIKRELVSGELNTVRRAMLPAIAAVGGMLVPAGIFAALNLAGPDRAGWGIPMATDIAFAVGCLALVRRYVLPSLGVFLTALAIFDDLGAILVIALFYGHGFHLAGAAATIGIVALLVLMNRLGVERRSLYFAIGALLWFAVLRSGVHATLAGVLLGLCMPAREPVRGLEHAVSLGVVPLFALANAGVRVTAISLADLASPVTLGIVLGLFVGKQVGVFSFTFAAVRLRLSPRPEGATWRQIYGIALLAGLGFTMSLFVAGLAFGETTAAMVQAKLGILLGSTLSAIAGLIVIRSARAA